MAFASSAVQAVRRSSEPMLTRARSTMRGAAAAVSCGAGEHEIASALTRTRSGADGLIPTDSGIVFRRAVVRLQVPRVRSRIRSARAVGKPAVVLVVRQRRPRAVGVDVRGQLLGYQEGEPAGRAEP